MASCSDKESNAPGSVLAASIGCPGPPPQPLSDECSAVAGLQLALMFKDSRDKVLKTEALLGEILVRTRSSKAYLRASQVGKFWRYTAKVLVISCEFARCNKACFLGFIVEFSEGYGPQLSLLAPSGALSGDPADTMREKFLPVGFDDKYVLGTHGGRIISRMESSSRQG